MDGSGDALAGRTGSGPRSERAGPCQNIGADAAVGVGVAPDLGVERAVAGVAGNIDVPAPVEPVSGRGNRWSHATQRTATRILPAAATPMRIGESFSHPWRRTRSG
jgi:hypothetical protein